jgi:hypothetical protein
MKPTRKSESGASAATESPSAPRWVHKVTVGVMGSAGGSLGKSVMEKVFTLGQEIARRGYVLVTGACPTRPSRGPSPREASRSGSPLR